MGKGQILSLPTHNPLKSSYHIKKKKSKVFSMAHKAIHAWSCPGLRPPPPPHPNSPFSPFHSSPLASLLLLDKEALAAPLEAFHSWLPLPPGFQMACLVLPKISIPCPPPPTKKNPKTSRQTKKTNKVGDMYWLVCMLSCLSPLKCKSMRTGHLLYILSVSSEPRTASTTK